jgi:hypothetical protein
VTNLSPTKPDSDPVTDFADLALRIRQEEQRRYHDALVLLLGLPSVPVVEQIKKLQTENERMRTALLALLAQCKSLYDLSKRQSLTDLCRQGLETSP